MRTFLAAQLFITVVCALGCIKRDYNSSGVKESEASGEVAAPKVPNPLVPRIATGGLPANQVRAPYDFNIGVKVFPENDCGLNGSIEDRIADCSKKNPQKSSMIDKKSAKNASWSLVVRGGLPRVEDAENANAKAVSNAVEVWRDNLTGLIWSDAIGGAEGKFNWCHASGSNNKKGSSYAEDDPFDFCDSEKFQNQTAPISLCVEEKELLNGTLESDPAKGGLGLLKGATTSVTWWMPTLDDYRLAFSHGAKYVLPHLTERAEWSASVFSWQRLGAWLFSGADGFVGLGETRNLRYGVRCVGVP